MKKMYTSEQLKKILEENIKLYSRTIDSSKSQEIAVLLEKLRKKIEEQMEYEKQEPSRIKQEEIKSQANLQNEALHQIIDKFQDYSTDELKKAYQSHLDFYNKFTSKSLLKNNIDELLEQLEIEIFARDIYENLLKITSIFKMSRLKKIFAKGYGLEKLEKFYQRIVDNYDKIRKSRIQLKIEPLVLDLYNEIGKRIK